MNVIKTHRLHIWSNSPRCKVRVLCLLACWEEMCRTIDSARFHLLWRLETHTSTHMLAAMCMWVFVPYVDAFLLTELTSEGVFTWPSAASLAGSIRQSRRASLTSSLHQSQGPLSIDITKGKHWAACVSVYASYVLWALWLHICEGCGWVCGGSWCYLTYRIKAFSSHQFYLIEIAPFIGSAKP